MLTPSDHNVTRTFRRSLAEPIDPVVPGVRRGDDQRTAATQARQHRLDNIQTGIQAPFPGNEHRTSKRARHGITPRALVLDLTLRGTTGRALPWSWAGDDPE